MVCEVNSSRVAMAEQSALFARFKYKIFNTFRYLLSESNAIYQSSAMTINSIRASTEIDELANGNSITVHEEKFKRGKHSIEMSYDLSETVELGVRYTTQRSN